MPAWRLRQVVNWVNLTTPLGLVAGLASGARPVRVGRGIWVAPQVRYPFLRGALTLGSVVLTHPPAEWLLNRPALLAHEERHAWQYVACLGLPMLPLYAVAAGVSWLWCRNTGTCNPFERLAGLADGGYPLTVEEARRRHRTRRTARRQTRV